MGWSEPARKKMSPASIVWAYFALPLLYFGSLVQAGMYEFAFSRSCHWQPYQIITIGLVSGQRSPFYLRVFVILEPGIFLVCQPYERNLISTPELTSTVPSSATWTPAATCSSSSRETTNAYWASSTSRQPPVRPRTPRTLGYT